MRKLDSQADDSDSQADGSKPSPSAGGMTARVVFEPEGMTARVVFEPEGKSALVARGTTINIAAVSAGVFIDAPCGDRGVCGKCRVRASGEFGSLTEAESKYMPPALLAEGWRLACQATIEGEAAIHVPRSSLQIAVDGLGREYLPEPSVRKLCLHLPPSDIENAQAAATRLREAFGLPNIDIRLSALRSLASLHTTTLTATLLRRSRGKNSSIEEIIAIEPGDTASRLFGLAFDVGTTTVVGALIDLASGRELSVAATLNKQALHGADVISRVKYSTEVEGGLAELQRTIVGVLNDLTEELCQKTGASPSDIYEATIVGNTCMHHIVLGISPASLGEAPYGATVADPTSVRASEIGLRIATEGRLYLLPVIAGHVGADTVGVILATGLHRSDELILVIDLGTNGESALGTRERMVACSTAAGPAFEGASIRHGMRATIGAIQGVRIVDGDIALSVVGENLRARPGEHPPASGICGSGLVDAVSELYLAGILDANGRMIDAASAPERLSTNMRERLVTVQGHSGSPERAFRLSRAGEPLVVLTQGDVRELQLAKGAIFAGARVLMNVLGVTDDDLTEVALAGAFGSYIRPESARTIGLIPNVPLQRIRAVGNAARAGARLALVSTEARQEAERIAKEVEHQELFARFDFMEAFTDAMGFPEKNEE